MIHKRLLSLQHGAGLRVRTSSGISADTSEPRQHHGCEVLGAATDVETHIIFAASSISSEPLDLYKVISSKLIETMIKLH